jgi:hypothetical protein
LNPVLEAVAQQVLLALPVLPVQQVPLVNQLLDPQVLLAQLALRELRVQLVHKAQLEHVVLLVRLVLPVQRVRHQLFLALLAQRVLQVHKVYLAQLVLEEKLVLLDQQVP